jgi:hypothetical protein
MSEPFYTSRVSVRKVAGVHRRATLPTGTEFDMGTPLIWRSPWTTSSPRPSAECWAR